MPTRRIHLINPYTDSFTTRPIFFGRALYSPLAGLLAVAGAVPQDRYEVVLTDENVEPIDFDLRCDLVGIGAMTSYVKRAYEIADEYRRRGVPVVLGGVHPSFMPDEALEHADAVVVGEAEGAMSGLLDDLEQGCMQGVYRTNALHPMSGLGTPRYELIKRHRYVNSSFVSICRGCPHGCTFCAEHQMFGLRPRYRPVDEIVREVEACGRKTIAINAADLFGHRKQAIAVMKALKECGVRWQAGVNSRAAGDKELLELAADSGCYMLSIGFESLSPEVLRHSHKHQNHPEDYARIVELVQSHGMLVFGLFMFGFDQDSPEVFDVTAQANIDANFDVCAYSILTPYPGTVDFGRMMDDGRITNFDWDKYDQGHIVYEPRGMSAEELRDGHQRAYDRFYSTRSLLKRFPLRGTRSRLQWLIYNGFFRKSPSLRSSADAITTPTAPPRHAAKPPLDGSVRLRPQAAPADSDLVVEVLKKKLDVSEADSTRS